jgi:hypothetical protein
MASQILFTNGLLQESGVFSVLPFEGSYVTSFLKTEF